ncbi:MAG: PhzF family phenazine biosynthesis protein [Steroidobacteraceae bacterium]|jgi:PhzF family phenazine biosynthesis protein|nr:PhzF family phenazine biosynthesis protein [Steroidobacteraceae bacterium]
MKARRFVQLDVFSAAAGQGNPLAVVLDAEGLDTAAMQSIAAWLNLSETTFVLPPSRGADYRVRIFTPRQELPFAGHPSVGTAHAVLDSRMARPRDGGLLQECGAGLLPVRIEGEGGGRRIHVRSPRGVERGADPALVVASLAGVRAGALAPALVDNGPRWWCVELADEASVRTMVPDLPAIANASLATGAVGLAVFSHCVGEPYALVVRAFVPADGIPEDPVTGSANAAIAALLHAKGRLPARSYWASQGREMGRDGAVEVAVDADGEAWIGGQTQTVVEGVIRW